MGLPRHAILCLHRNCIEPSGWMKIVPWWYGILWNILRCYISRRDDHLGRVVTQSEYRQYFYIIRESYWLEVYHIIWKGLQLNKYSFWNHLCSCFSVTLDFVTLINCIRTICEHNLVLCQWKKSNIYSYLGLLTKIWPLGQSKHYANDLLIGVNVKS